MPCTVMKTALLILPSWNPRSYIKREGGKAALLLCRMNIHNPAATKMFQTIFFNTYDAFEISHFSSGKKVVIEESRKPVRISRNFRKEP